MSTPLKEDPSYVNPIKNQVRWSDSENSLLKLSSNINYPLQNKDSEASQQKINIKYSNQF